MRQNATWTVVINIEGAVCECRCWEHEREVKLGDSSRRGSGIKPAEDANEKGHKRHMGKK